MSHDSISVGSNIFYLHAGLWRDFMPQSPKDGKPLICVDELIEKDSLAVSPDIHLIKQYVLNGDQIWINYYSEVSSWQNFILEGTVRNGPKWGPDISVDVVCEFAKGDSIYRLLAKDVKIIATF